MGEWIGGETMSNNFNKWIELIDMRYVEDIYLDSNIREPQGNPLLAVGRITCQAHELEEFYRQLAKQDVSFHKILCHYSNGTEYPQITLTF